MNSIIICDRMVQDRFRVKLIQTEEGFFLHFIRYFNDPPFSSTITVKLEDFEEGMRNVYETVAMIKENEADDEPEYPPDLPIIPNGKENIDKN